MKRLYALLVILIIIYIGINVGAGGLNFLAPDSTQDNTDDSTQISIGDAGIPDLENFTSNKINDTAVSLKDESKNMTITVSEIDNSQDIAEIASNDYANSGRFTSNQTIDQNGVPVYLLYSEGSESYGADIYFNKNNQNFMITGSDISYDNSDYFINHCKEIIDSMGN